MPSFLRGRLWPVIASLFSVWPAAVGEAQTSQPKQHYLPFIRLNELLSASKTWASGCSLNGVNAPQCLSCQRVPTLPAERSSMYCSIDDWLTCLSRGPAHSVPSSHGLKRHIFITKLAICCHSGAQIFRFKGMFKDIHITEIFIVLYAVI